MKFTEPGWTVDVEASVQGWGWIQLCVSDTGRGIAPDEVAHVFESFFRASGRSRHDGTGLGLTITKKLVELHSGRIWVNSTAEKGSRFYVALPLYVPLHLESLPPPLCPL